jgi:hypothetical protein
MLKFIKKNQILNIYQSGFRKFHQTNDHILRLIQAVKSSFNLNFRTGALFIDIEKAFDKGLIYKIKQYNFPAYLIYWIQDYLSGHLFNPYLLKANRANPLINNEIKTYKIAPLHKEGLFCKLKNPQKLPSTYKATELFK